MEIILPEEILIKIALYLESRDVLNCCLVNKFWRNALNANKIWFNLCRKEFLIKKTNRSPLIERKPSVKPHFVQPKNHSYELSDICLWRIRYMQEKHITKNWKNGNFRVQKITKTTKFHLKGIRRNDFICSDDVLIAYRCVREDDQRFRVWQITKDSFIEKEPIICPNRWSNVEYYSMTEDGFLFVQDCLLVYYLRQEDFSFKEKFRVLITRDVRISKRIPKDQDITAWYLKNVWTQIGFYSMSNNDRYFVAPEYDLDDGVTFHIWDLLKCTRQREYFTPKSLFFDLSIKLLDHAPKLLIDFAFQSGCPPNTYPIFLYDLVTRKFTIVNLQISSPLTYPILCENHVVGLNRTNNTIDVWCNRTGDFIRSISQVKTPKGMDIHLSLISPNYIIACDGDYEKIVIIKIDSNSTDVEGVFTFKDSVDSTVFIKPDMLLLQIDSNELRDYVYSELHDLKSSVKLHNVYPVECLLNPSRTKLIDVNAYKVYHFW